jgi:hypothetical protein
MAFERTARHIAMGNTVISGQRALVGVTGRLCFPGQGCRSNTDPSAGLPPARAKPREYNSRWRFRSPLVRRQGFKLTG